MQIETRHPDFSRIVRTDTEVTQLATGFGFTEGPAWDAKHARLIFSDMKHDHMRCWNARTGISTYRKPSNQVNGNTFDRQGRLVSCEHATSRVVRQEHDGSLSILATHYGERELNSPNDIVVKSDGAIYFTDPTYGRVREDVGTPRALQLSFRGVYRIAPDGALRLLADDFEQPNGLCFSRDESQLFVNDTVRKHIRVFDVAADGGLRNSRAWAELTGEAIGSPDGMKIDSAGHLYCTGPGGIHIFAPDARCLGVILTPEKAANFAWGDDDLRSVFITAMTSLYRVRVEVPGRLGS